MDNKEYIELPEHRAMIMLPENSVELTMLATVYVDGKLQTVSMTYDMGQIREMFQKADDGYFDDDDTYVITEAGRAWLEGRESPDE